MTQAQRLKYRAERAAMANPVDRIVFDNQRVALPLGLVLLAFEAEDAEKEAR